MAVDLELIERPSYIHRLGISHLRTSAYHPQTDAKCERVHFSVHNIITKLIDDKHDRWPDLLGTVASEESPQRGRGFLFCQAGPLGFSQRGRGAGSTSEGTGWPRWHSAPAHTRAPYGPADCPIGHSVCVIAGSLGLATWSGFGQAADDGADYRHHTATAASRATWGTWLWDTDRSNTASCTAMETADGISSRCEGRHDNDAAFQSTNPRTSVLRGAAGVGCGRGRSFASRTTHCSGGCTIRAAAETRGGCGGSTPPGGIGPGDSATRLHRHGKADVAARQHRRGHQALLAGSA